VILSHLHWDHIGTPSDFTKSTFIVGPGSLDLLRHGGDVSKTGSHSHFERDLLPTERTIELPPPGRQSSQNTKIQLPGIANLQWKPIANFPHAIDIFEDGSLFIINAPGHLQGHINLLARTGPKNWVYLAGDACHDRRLLRGELSIAEWEKDGKVCCIHVDKGMTEETLERIKGLERGGGVEVILAHDREWIDERGNEERFWPGKL
jgi:glyoxylase-like metal-dependent hydrolase (beta-lactamase superfamily II)